MLMQLYPTTRSIPLKGAYLAHNLRKQETARQTSGEQIKNANRPYIYANFVTSLDGRIAIVHSDDSGLAVPPNVANDRDWRLFQELAVQADLIISSGRYLRDWANGRAQEILRVDEPEFADLRAWRLEQGLKPQPDIAIVSGSLNFPMPDILTTAGRRVIILTMDNADPSRRSTIEQNGGDVYSVGSKSIDGELMIQTIEKLGYRTVYSGAGPQIAHMLLTANMLDRIYLTHVSRILGGSPFASIVEGPLLEHAADFKLNTIYWDGDALDTEPVVTNLQDKDTVDSPELDCSSAALHNQSGKQQGTKIGQLFMSYDASSRR